MIYCTQCGCQNSNNAKVCERCGSRMIYPPVSRAAGYQQTAAAPAPKKTNGAKKVLLILVIALCAAILSGAVLILTHVICINHEWRDATCTEPEVCRYCDETDGEALGHEYEDATCTKAQTCSRCGEEKGTPNGHEWEDITCTEPKICVICGATEKEAPGHAEGEWIEVQPATLMVGGEEELRCSVCDEVLDSREIEVKDAGIDGTSFNFAADEFVAWVNKEMNITVEERPMEEVELEENREAYLVRAEEDNGALILEYDEDGNVCLIRSYFREDLDTSIAVAMVIADKIDPEFDAIENMQTLLSDRIYSKSGMVLAILDDSEVVIVPEQYMEEMS